ncbi:MAG: beta strand repeat-containing protein, partial [Acidobacteriaceae bacterium]
MEKPLQMLLWGGFAVGVMTFGFFPTMWTVTQAGTAHTVAGNAGLAQTLWGGQSGYHGPTMPSALSASVQYPQSTNVAIIPGALTPTIASLTWSTSTWPPTLTIQGSGFGNPSSTGETVTITDTTRGWTATGIVQSFTNTEIVLSNFTPTYGGGDPQNWADGLGSFVLAPGDALTVSVTNPETGQAGTLQAQAPATMPLPTVTLSSLSPQILTFGQSVTVTGTVTFDGQPLAGQAVNLSAPAGTFSASGGTQATPSDYMVFTDSAGHFTASYIAPSAAGSQTLSAMAGSVTATETAQVVAPPQITGVTWNTGTWPPQITVVGSGLGNTGIVSVIENASGQGAVWDNNTNTPDNKLQVSSWSDTGISAGNFASYGAANGFYFAPGEAVGITVTNGQTGQSASYTATYPANAPMPTVELNPVAAIDMGQSTVVSGNVSFGGTGLANQQVSLTASGGTLGASTVQTDASGNFSATYTAGNAGGTFSVSAASDTGSASASVTVSVPAPTVTWAYPSGRSFTVAQAQATGCGQGVTWSFTPPSTGGYAGWSQSWDTPWNQLQFTSTSGCLSPSGLSVGTHQVDLMFFFAGGQTAIATSSPITITASPSVSISATTPLFSGASEDITGTVAVNGTPDANVTVALSTPSSDGTWSSTTVTTNGSGQFSDTYTAPSTSGTFTLSATSGGVTGTVPIVVEPMQITGVTWNTGTWGPSVTVSGNGFGASTGNVELLDSTWTVWWNNTGQNGPAMNPANFGADGMSASWGDTAIGLSGFSGYGQNVGWRDFLTPGDAITVYVENTQTGQTASYNTTYPSSAPMPAIALNSIASVQTGQSTTVSGTVTWQGQALGNALVTLSATGGSLGNTAVTTNSSGQFSATYTAPSGTGTDTITASSFTSTASTNVTVTSPMSITSVSVTQSVQAPPQFTINGTGFGSSSSGEYVQLQDFTRSWQGGTA